MSREIKVYITLNIPDDVAEDCGYTDDVIIYHVDNLAMALHGAYTDLEIK